MTINIQMLKRVKEIENSAFQLLIDAILLALLFSCCSKNL